MRTYRIVLPEMFIVPINTGHKTRLHIPFKVQPPRADFSLLQIASSIDKKKENAFYWGIVKDLKIIEKDKNYFHPPYKKGDVLIVKEAIEIDGYLDLYYKADNEVVWADDGSHDDWFYKEPEWTGVIPATRMPLWAARTKLEVTEVWAHRLHSISEEDTIQLPEKPFTEIWDTTTKKKYRWQKNPWVWRICFKRIKE